MKRILVQATSVTQSANTVLNTKEKILWYLIIGEGENKIVINVGEKTHDSVKKYIETALKGSDEIKEVIAEVKTK